MVPNLAGGQLSSVRASLEADSAKAEALRQLQAAQAEQAWSSQQWDQERQQLQVCIGLPASCFGHGSCTEHVPPQL